MALTEKVQTLGRPNIILLGLEDHQAPPSFHSAGSNLLASLLIMILVAGRDFHPISRRLADSRSLRTSRSARSGLPRRRRILAASSSTSRWRSSGVIKAPLLLEPGCLFGRAAQAPAPRTRALCNRRVAAMAERGIAATPTHIDPERHETLRFRRGTMVHREPSTPPPPHEHDRSLAGPAPSLPTIIKGSPFEYTDTCAARTRLEVMASQNIGAILDAGASGSSVGPCERSTRTARSTQPAIPRRQFWYDHVLVVLRYR
jgi:hypothetical protein